MCCELFNILSTRNPPLWPTDKTRNPVTAFIGPVFMPAHSRVISFSSDPTVLIDVYTYASAIVRQVNEYCVFLELEGFQLLVKPSHVFVNIGNHAIKPSSLL